MAVLCPGSHTNQKCVCCCCFYLIFRYFLQSHRSKSFFSTLCCSVLLSWALFSPNVSPRLFVRALIPCCDDIMVSAQPISFREFKLTVPATQLHKTKAEKMRGREKKGISWKFSTWKKGINSLERILNASPLFFANLCHIYSVIKELCFSSTQTFVHKKWQPKTIS